MLRFAVFHLFLHVVVEAFVSFPPEHVASNNALKTSSSDYSVSDEQRRNFFASLFIATGSAVAVSSFDSQRAQVLSQFDDTTATVIENLDRAVEYIDTECDRRFLHAVVSSDYKLLYKGLSSPERIAVCSAPEDLLHEVPFFRTMQEELRNQPIQPSNSRIAVANPVAAQRMGSTVCSVWPLGANVHFAWLEQGSAFRGAWDTKMIVDGVDCGRMSLEDALESNKEILFRSERYLAVPLSMEQDFVRKLKDSFII